MNIVTIRILLPSLALVLVGWVDYLTGPRLAFSPFYLVVLVLIALRNHWIVAMLYGLMASAVFLAVDLLTNPSLRWTIFPYWRALGQLISFSMVTFTVPKLMEERQRLAESEAILTMHRSELQELNARLSAALEELDAAKEEKVRKVHGRQVKREDLAPIFNRGIKGECGIE